MKTRRVARAARAGVMIGACLLGLASGARALTTSDNPASILIWPKIVVGGDVDTLIDISNLNQDGKLVAAHCWLIDASGDECSAIDFDIYITQNQPLAWRASEGMRDFPRPFRGLCSGTTIPCDPTAPWSGPCPASSTCQDAQGNAGSLIPPVPSMPFVGALKCTQYNATTDIPEQGSLANSLIGHASIVTVSPDGGRVVGADVERYNAVGIRHLNAHSFDGTLKLDGDQYAQCPAVLILDHPFDGAPLLADDTDVPVYGSTLTDLTLVPCGDDFLRDKPGQAVAQILVFNEFEQRLSASKPIKCFYESPLSLIDTSYPERSIFSYKVQGTVAGQTLIKGSGSAATGNGLVGIARTSAGTYAPGSGGNFGAFGSSAAYGLDQRGTKPGTADTIWTR